MRFRTTSYERRKYTKASQGGREPFRLAAAPPGPARGRQGPPGPPGAARSRQEPPGAARRRQGSPGAARTSQGPPGATSSSQKPPGAARGRQGPPGADTATSIKPLRFWNRLFTFARVLQCILKALQNRSEKLNNSFRTASFSFQLGFVVVFESAHAETTIKLILRRPRITKGQAT